jgi:hypothetical protein
MENNTTQTKRFTTEDARMLLTSVPVGVLLYTIGSALRKEEEDCDMPEFKSAMAEVGRAVCGLACRRDLQGAIRETSDYFLNRPEF